MNVFWIAALIFGLAVEVALLTGLIRWKQRGYGRAFTRQARVELVARRQRVNTLQVALFALGKGVPLSPAPSKPNGVTEGTRYQPAPSSGPQRVVE
jgi:uncharacterized iron-regulated membrane protein